MGLRSYVRGECAGCVDATRHGVGGKWTCGESMVSRIMDGRIGWGATCLDGESWRLRMGRGGVSGDMSSISSC